MLHDPPNLENCQEPSGLFGLTREGRKKGRCLWVQIALTQGKKAAAAFVRALPQQPPSMCPAWLLWWCPPWRSAQSEGLWGSPSCIWEHQNLRTTSGEVVGSTAGHYSFCTPKPLDTVDPYNQASIEFSVNASRNRIMSNNLWTEIIGS